MIVTLAKLIHRDEMPEGLVGKTFCDLTFMGVDEEFIAELEERWQTICNGTSNDVELKSQLEEKIVDLSIEIADLEKTIRSIHRWYKPMNPVEKKLKEDLALKNNQVIDFQNMLNQVLTNKPLPKELAIKATELLESAGFIKITETKDGFKSVTHTSIWQYQED